MSRKVTSLPKIIQYVKRSKYSLHDFSAKHTPSATLIVSALDIRIVFLLIKSQVSLSLCVVGYDISIYNFAFY